VHVLVKETSAIGAANSVAFTPATELSSVETRGNPPLAESRVTFRAACLVLIILLERVGYCVTSPRTRSRHAQLPLRRGATSVSGSRGTSRAPRCIIRRELSPFVAARFSFVYFRLFSFFFHARDACESRCEGSFGIPAARKAISSSRIILRERARTFSGNPSPPLLPVPLCFRLSSLLAPRDHEDTQGGECLFRHPRDK